MPHRFRRRNNKKSRNLKKIIKKVIKSEAEKKYLENFDSGDLTNASSFESSLNLVPVGDTFAERIGDKISPSLLTIRFQINHLMTAFTK